MSFFSLTWNDLGQFAWLIFVGLALFAIHRWDRRHPPKAGE